jgi:plastocyanin
MLWRATVQRENAAKPIGFSPQQQQAQAGDALFWFNEDTNTSHQPVPDTGVWNIPPIPGNNSSDQLSLGNPGTLAYHCAIHPEEKGTIKVSNAVLIAAGANPLFGSTTIAPGQSVSWGNSDAQAHQPAPVGGQPWTAPVPSGDLSASVDFPQAGSFPYACALHPNDPAETGTIIVKAS